MVYGKTKPEKFNPYLYNNPYNPWMMRFSYSSSLAATTLCSYLCGYFIHPFTSVAFFYDFYIFLKHFRILNQMVELMAIEKNKTHVMVRCYNFLGFVSPKVFLLPISELVYVGVKENDTI